MAGNSRQEIRRAVCAVAFFSGGAALAHEVVWTRMLSGVFGTTAGATAVVLACYMIGMGAGGLALGRVADRLNVRDALGLYGALELAAAGLAGLVPFLVWLSGFVYGVIFRATDGSELALGAARICLSSAALLPPALALGGTFPAMVSSCTSPEDPENATGAGMGLLYAANTAGAVVGCFLTGYAIIPTLGVLGTAALAVAASASVGVVALWLASTRREEESPARAAETGPTAAITDSRTARWIVPALYAASGFAALGCEVLWTRALVFILRTTVYAFTAMLTVFLLGLAAGGALGAVLVRSTRRHGALFAGLEAGAAASVALSLLVMKAMASGWDELDIALGEGWAISTMLHLAISAAMMLLPTLFFGALLPAAGALHARVAPPSSAAGELYLGNALGGALGSLTAGFILSPLLGTGRAVAVLACVNLMVAAAAFAMLSGAPRPLGIRALAMAGMLSVAAILWLPDSAAKALFAATISKAELVFTDEAAEAVVTVHRYPESSWRVLSVSSVQVAGTAPPLRSTQILQGLIPVLLHPAPRSALQVGLGSGETSRVALSAGAQKLLCVEIAPGVVRAARELFADINMGVLDDPRMKLLVADGKGFLRHSRERFDLVLSESTYPFLSGSSGLYTLDYFRYCRARLLPGGMLSVWLPLDVPELGVRSILRTFAEVFPYSVLWTTNAYGYKHGLLLGSEAPIVIRCGHLRRRTGDPEIKKLLEIVGIPSWEDLTASLMLDRRGMKAFGESGPLHTDDHPVLEYQTSLRSGLHWRARLASNFEALGRHRSSILESISLEDVPSHEREKVLEALREADARAVRSIRQTVELFKAQAEIWPELLAARKALKKGRLEEALSLYRVVLSKCPSDNEAREELGMLLIQMGRFQEAQELAGETQ